MATILLTFVIALLVFGAMSLGIIFGRPPIKGSCGGMGAMAGGDASCELCGGNRAKCPEGSTAIEKSAASPPQIFDPKNVRR